MGKKQISQGPRMKKTKSKHKEMFPELATHQQQLVQRNAEVRKPNQKRVIEEDSEEEVELDVLQHQNNDLDTICQAVHKLLSKNKVSAKNAFDVPLIDLQRLPDFQGSLQNQYAWKKLSSTLQNDYKIYAYRVDAIHSITYNILHTMSRRQQDTQALQNPPPAAGQGMNQSQPLQPERIPEGAEGEHLQKKIQNINLTQFQLALGVDPILQRNKRKFDILGSQNMLLNSLCIDDQLALELVRDTTLIKKYPPWGDYKDVWNTDDPLMAFTQLSEFRAKTNQNLQGKMRDEEVYDLFMDQKENYYYENYSNVEIQKSVYSKQKDISKYINWKPPIKYNINNDIIDQADNWMDERHLLLKKAGVKTEPIIKNEVKYENPQDLVNFDLNYGAQQDTRQSIFLKQNDKAEFKEDIQDKFLLAKRLSCTFEIQKYPLTLKENPKIYDTTNNKSLDVDVRRQMISISDAKRKMKDLLHGRSTFKTLYTGYKQFDDISPALCFLTMLHLANEHELNLDQIDETNFYIR